MRPGYLLLGLLSALLFGIATPLSKILLADLSQFQLAGLLYLGAGLGMAPFVLAGRRGAPQRTDAPRRRDRRNVIRLAAVVLFGGCLGPVLLLAGLSTARASSVSLWLNLELAATAVLGALFFRDHLDRLGAVGVAGALLAGVLVTVNEGIAGVAPALLVSAACLCWGLDNCLTSLIDGFTPQEMTFVKGIVAGTVNTGIAVATVGGAPGAAAAAAGLGLGAVCYGGSIVLFITAAQQIGAARGQVLFAGAPFFGVLLSVLLLGERVAWLHLPAALLLACSILLLHRARHAHVHRHPETVHIHRHSHDDLHHAHAHEGLAAEVPRSRQHTHEHGHQEIEHEHPHVPDLHHRHGHAAGKAKEG